MTQDTGTSVALAFKSHEVMMKVGTKEKAVAVETAMVLGGKTIMAMLVDAAYLTATKKAQDGNYRAAVEIMSLGATVAQVKGLAPEAGKVWTKGRVLTLAELILERTPKDPAKGWSKNALKGRSMARLILDMEKAPAKPAGEVSPATSDDLEGVVG